MRSIERFLTARTYTSLVIAGAALYLAGCGGGAVTEATLPAQAPGELDALLAELDQAPVPDGVDAEVFARLTAELARVLTAQGGLKQASAPPVDDGSATRLSLETGTGELTWEYYATGDYDQNGEVNISDLTPLALHFGKSGGFAPNSIEAVVDGDGNGEINISDVSPIGINFSRVVAGYNVYTSNSFLDLPNQNDGPNGNGTQLTVFVPFGDALGARTAERVHFSYMLPSVPPGSLYWVRPSDGSTDGTSSAPTVPEGDTLTPEGGAVQIDDLIFIVPPDALVADVQFTHSLVPQPTGGPDGFVPIGDAHDIGVSDPDLLNAPIVIQIPYDDTGVQDEESMIALHYDDVDGFSPLTILNVDTARNVITVDSRDFSLFLVGYIAASLWASFPDSHDVGFTAGSDGWNINNFGSYFSSGGNCFGMSGYAAWFWEERPENLFGKYDTTGGAPTSIAHLTATRAHLAQSQYWGLKFHNFEQTLGESKTGKLMKYFLWQFDDPLIFVMLGSPGGHAGVVYGWDATGFKFYDVNFSGAGQNVTWSSAVGFGSYPGGFAAPGFTKFSFVAFPSLGRTEDFAALTTEAEGDFTGSSDINLTSPDADEEIDGREVQLTGTLSGSLNSLSQIVCYVKGVRLLVPVSASSFNTTIPISAGENTLIILAGININSQSNWYKNGATLIRNVTGTGGASDLLVTLSWNQNQTDVDLYVTEPGGQTAWYASLFTSNGLELDFDNTTGYGPEHITLNSAEGDTILPGAYAIDLHYYKDHGGGAVSGNVSVILHEGTPEQTLQNFPFSIGTDNSTNDNPGSSGPDWVSITTATIQNP